MQRVVDAAEKLGVKYVISPECGHAFTAIRWEGPNLIGRSYKFQVIHILELLDQLRSEGRLKTRGKESKPLTFHDPCQIVRRGGVVAQPRRLLGEVASDLRDMKDHGTINWCCGGGGGVQAIGRAAKLRHDVFKIKIDQVEKTGAKTMVSSCSNCRLTMDESKAALKWEGELGSLVEIIADHLIEDDKPASAAE